MTSESVDLTVQGVRTHRFRGCRPRLDSPVPRGPSVLEYVSAIPTKGGDKGQVPNCR